MASLKKFTWPNLLGVEATDTSLVSMPHKVIYGLKQAPRAWFERLKTALLQFGFKDRKYAPSLFIYYHNFCIVYLRMI